MKCVVVVHTGCSSKATFMQFIVLCKFRKDTHKLCELREFQDPAPKTCINFFIWLLNLKGPLSPGPENSVAVVYVWLTVTFAADITLRERHQRNSI